MQTKKQLNYGRDDTPKLTRLDRYPNDNWAQVELYRWQHGELPGEDGHAENELNVPVALKCMADMLLQPDMNKYPHPSNIASVLRYAATLIENTRIAASSPHCVDRNKQQGLGL